MFFKPIRFPSMTVTYDYIPGQHQTNWQPDFQPQIDFTSIEINGDTIDLALEEHLISTFGDDWENEINRF